MAVAKDPLTRDAATGDAMGDERFDPAVKPNEKISIDEKVSIEKVELKGRPQPVVRLNRLLIVLAAALLLAAAFGATFAALQMPRHEGERRELLQLSGQRPVADSLSNLPSNYGEMRPPAPPPNPPLSNPPPPRPSHSQPERAVERSGIDTEVKAAEAERQRLARLAQQAREAGVFFRVKANGAQIPGPVTAASHPGQAAPSAAAQEPEGGNRPQLTALPLDLENDQNHQRRKLDFMQARSDASTLNPHALQDLLSPYQLLAGSVISASLVSGINSDLPGLVKAQVTEPVYDTVSGRHLLIPQGSQLIGRYDSVIAYGQSRALIVWQRIIMPDGTSIVVDNLPASDSSGYAGLADAVDYHTWRLIGGVALSTLLGVGTELTFGDEESDLVRAIRESAQQNTNRAGQRITERNLNIQPTITIRPGWPLTVIVHRDLLLRPYQG